MGPLSIMLQRTLQRVNTPRYLLFVCVNQFFVVSVLEFSRCFCSRQGGMEDEKLPRALCCLKATHKMSGCCGFIFKRIINV